jgi:hypothetical protein
MHALMAAILLGMTRTNALDRDPQPQPPANSGERPLSARSSISLVRLGRDERDLILRLSELQARLVTGTSLAKKPVPRSGAVVLHLGDETEVARMGKPRGTRHPEPDSHPIVEHARPPINCGDRAYPSRRKQHQAQQAWPGRITERNR